MAVYLSLIAAVVFVYLGFRFSRGYFRLRGTRVVTCPADQSNAAVEVNARQAAASAVFGAPRFTLTACSHWPERQACGRQCVSEIQAAPVDCLVRTHLTRWYQDKICAICKRPFGTIDWYERRPALLSPEHMTVVWADVNAAQLGDILTASQPVCYDCHVAETFRRARPDLVLDNPYASLPPGRTN